MSKALNVHNRTVTIVNKLGLHARAAAKFVTLASSYASDIKVARDGQEVNGKSIMGVMMLAASKGTEITLIANGNDEKDAIGRRYRRQDAIGTPFAVTIDHETLKDNCVTVRERDSMQQRRIAKDALLRYLDDELGAGS